jgi:hypothetical protein
VSVDPYFLMQSGALGQKIREEWRQKMPFEPGKINSNSLLNASFQM